MILTKMWGCQPPYRVVWTDGFDTDGPYSKYDHGLIEGIFMFVGVYADLTESGVVFYTKTPDSFWYKLEFEQSDRYWNTWVQLRDLLMSMEPHQAFEVFAL